MFHFATLCNTMQNLYTASINKKIGQKLARLNKQDV